MADLDIEAQNFYRRAIDILDRAEVPFLVGGAYALAHYTDVVRHTKDFDMFLRSEDSPRALDAFGAAGFHTELTFAHWLAKVFCGEDFVDLIFSSGNGVAKVGDAWFEHAPPARFLGREVRLCPVEEMIWSKAFVVERERYDGADINHLIRAHGAAMDWKRVLHNFGPHWRVLLSHLVLYGFVYPSDRDRVPTGVMQELLGRLRRELESPPPRRRVCRGTLLSRIQYVVDLEQWGYEDARLDAESGMTEGQADAWTDAGLRGA
jgi:hypothetical protein